MKYSTRTADAVYILVLIALNQGNTSSQKLAESTAASPAHVRKLMSLLKKGGLIHTQQGKACPSLAKDPSAVTLLDIYRIMEGDIPLLHLDTHTNPDCHEGVHIQYALQEKYNALQAAFEADMAAVTLQEIISQYQHRLKMARQSACSQ